MESVSGDISTTSRALEAQVTSRLTVVDKLRATNELITGITWSAQADFGYVPAAYVDGSFLVVGSRSGSLTFLRYVYINL